jgi:hypothetical protein
VRKLLNTRGVVALVGDGDNVVAKLEREQQLGCRWNERSDAHGDEDGTWRDVVADRGVGVADLCYARRVCR